jgi:hypothetical protein
MAARGVLWLHAGLWTLFAGGMIALAITAPDSRSDPVFVQVTVAASAAMVGSIAAALRRAWGAALALLGGLAVIAAWTLGDSGRELRMAVALVLAIFVVAASAERRTAV